MPHAGPTPAGQFQNLTLADADVRYTLSLPGGEAPLAPAPLVVSLHYGGPVSPWYGRALLESVVEPALRSLGAVILAPDCPSSAWADSPCEAAVLAVMAAVRARYPIDAGRVLLTGYSKGGIGTWALAARHPGAFTAAIVLAGAPPREVDIDPARWRVPTRVIHAREDEVLALGPTQALVAQLRDAGAPVDLSILDGVTHFETGRFEPPLRALIPWLRELWCT